MSTPMDQLTKLNSLSLPQDEEEYDKIATEAVQQLNKQSDLETYSLEAIDPRLQTIAYFHVLCAHIDASLKSGKAPSKQLPSSVLPEGRFWPRIAAILLEFDPIQVRYAGACWLKVVEIVVRGADQTKDYIPAIQLLKSAVFRLDQDRTPSTLTSVHYAYVRLCTLAKAYTDAVILLDCSIYHLPSDNLSKSMGDRAYRRLCSTHSSGSLYITAANKLTEKITHRVYLEYFLFGGMCYMGTGQYEKALLHFEVVLTAPTAQNAVSLVQLDAFKKWTFLSLVVHGTPGKLPKHLAQVTLRNLRAMAKPYEVVAEAFKSGKLERVQGELDEGMGIWQEDENIGLVHEVFSAFRKFAVLNLAKTYAALPIRQIAELTSPDPNDVQETTSYITSLIANGDLQATISQSSTQEPGTLRFAAEQRIPVPESALEQELVFRTRQLQLLLKHIQDLDHHFEIHKDYIDYLQKLRNARDRTKKSDAAANRGIGIDDHDEDMMEDL